MAGGTHRSCRLSGRIQVVWWRTVSLHRPLPFCGGSVVTVATLASTAVAIQIEQTTGNGSRSGRAAYGELAHVSSS